MTRPNRIVQPGPAIEARVVAVEGRGRAFNLRLPAGGLLVEAVREGLAREGFAAGVINIKSLALHPFAYVMPALSKDGKNAAFYSDTFRPEGITRLEGGALTFGQRHGAPFFHCHALWREPDGKRSGGHILPEETVIAEAADVRAFGFEGGGFVGRLDPEINFTVFGPEAAPPAGARTDCRAFALRLRPNQDFHGALEAFCRAQGIARARVHGGVGSLIGALFEDGHEVEPFATEVFLTGGDIAPHAAGNLIATLDAGLVDYTGALASGRLTRGANPVLMTFELIISET